MTLSESEKAVLLTIQSKMRRGDISSIAEKLGNSKEYVGMVLNPNIDRYSEAIVMEAIKIITEREQNTKKLLQTIAAA